MTFKKVFITFVKISVSVALLYLVFKKVPFSEIFDLIKTSKLYFLLFALICFLLSQIISAQRLLLYFKTKSFNINKVDNFKLYLVGMFYNFFVPGGIGGDGYKVYLLHKKFNWKVKTLAKSILCDRLSGLLAIIILLELLATIFLVGYFKLLVVPVVLATILISRLIFNLFFSDFRFIFHKSLFYSLLIQCLQVLSVYFILKSLYVADDFWIYFIVFLISAILSVLSFSGIGIREWFFLKSAAYFTFDANIAVSTALIFSFLTAFVAVFGIYFQVMKLDIKLDEDL